MNARGIPAPALAPLGAAVGFVREAWAAVRARDVLAVAGLCLLWSVIDLAALIEPIVFERMWGPALNGVLSRQFSGIAVLYAVAIADHASRRGEARAWWYVVAVVGGTLVGTIAMWAFSQRLLGIPTAHRGAAAYEPFARFVARHCVGALSACGLATAIFLTERGARRRAANLSRLQRGRAELERHVAATRLAAHRARIDPAFLVDTLGRIDRGYRCDPRAADRLLRALVSYLRAAIPQTRNPESTLRRELALASAWLQVANAESLVRMRIDLPAGLDARVPPRLLLSLLAGATAVPAREPHDGREVSVAATAADGRLRIVLRGARGCFDARTAASEDVAELRDVLPAFYGTDAKLAFRVEDDRSEVTLDVPHESPREAPPRRRDRTAGR